MDKGSKGKSWKRLLPEKGFLSFVMKTATTGFKSFNKNIHILHILISPTVM